MQQAILLKTLILLTASSFLLACNFVSSEGLDEDQSGQNLESLGIYQLSFSNGEFTTYAGGIGSSPLGDETYHETIAIQFAPLGEQWTAWLSQDFTFTAYNSATYYFDSSPNPDAAELPPRIVMNPDTATCSMYSFLPLYVFGPVVNGVRVRDDRYKLLLRIEPTDPNRCADLSQNLTTMDLDVQLTVFDDTLNSSNGVWYSRSTIQRHKLAELFVQNNSSEDCTNSIPESLDEGDSFCATRTIIDVGEGDSNCVSFAVTDGKFGLPEIEVTVTPIEPHTESGKLSRGEHYSVSTSYECTQGDLSWRTCIGHNKGALTSGYCSANGDTQESPYTAYSNMVIRSCSGEPRDGTATVCINPTPGLYYPGSYKLLVRIK